MTNNKRDYKKEYQAFVLRKQNNKEYAEKHRKDGAARSNKSWHKNKTPEKQKQKRLYIKEYTLKYPERRKLTAKKTYEKIKTDPIKWEKRTIYHRNWIKNKRITMKTQNQEMIQQLMDEGDYAPSYPFGKISTYIKIIRCS